MMNFNFLSIVVLWCIVSISIAQGTVIVVPGTSNPWLAGMPDGTLAVDGDVSPTHSPVLVTGIALSSGNWVEFSNVTGAVNYGPWGPGFAADGGVM